MKLVYSLILFCLASPSFAATTYNCILNESGDKMQLTVQSATTIVINNINLNYLEDTSSSNKVYFEQYSTTNGSGNTYSYTLTVPSSLASTDLPQEFNFHYKLETYMPIFGSPMWNEYTGTCTL